MQKNSTYQQIIPLKDELKPFIKLYYIHKSEDPNFKEKITYFPNYVTTLNIYQYSRVTSDEFSRTHTYDSKKQFSTLLVGKFDRSREIFMDGPFNKISIVFNPLGFNHFLPEPLSNFIEDNFSFFNYFGDGFNTLIKNVFSENDLKIKRNLLDEYFSRKLIGFEETRLIQAVSKILNFNEKIKTEDIANDLNISRKTLLRLFKKHLSYSPQEYLAIVKFRKALQDYQFRESKPTLSSFAYESGYYDQSDFYRRFKVKTGLNPKQLFTKLTTIEKGLYWKLD